MRMLTALRLHWRALVHRDRIDAEIDEEMRDHLEREVAARTAAGMTAEEAWRTALRDFGGQHVHKADSRSRTAQWCDDFVTDLRYALRALARDWSFAAITILTLALGIGANVTIFSAIDAVLLRPLPYPGQHRLVSIRQQDTRNPAKRDNLSPGNFLDVRDRAASVLDIAAAEPFSQTLMLPDGPTRIRTWRVSDRFFDVLGVPAALGRTFVPTDFVAGHDTVMVLGHGTWMRQFGGDRGIIGRVMRVNNQPFTIVGVMPADFAFPPGPDVWTPTIFTSDDRRERASTYLHVVGRLRDGISLDAARGRLDVVWNQLRAEYPQENGRITAAATPLPEALAGSAPRVLALFLAAVALLLITTCANVGNLSLVRVHRRRQEFAVRTALGAGAGRIRRQVLTESLVMTALGATAGILLSRWAVAIVRTMAPNTLPRAEQMTVSAEAVFAAYALAAATAIAIALLSLAALSRTPSAISAVSATSVRGASMRRGWLQRSFVALQLAIATMLVVAAGLLVRSLTTLIGEARGFRTDHVLTVTTFAWRDFPKPEQRAHFVEQAIDRLEAIPGVMSAAVGSSLPLAERIGPELGRFTIPGIPVPADQAPSAQATIVSPGYFESLGISIRQGRAFTRDDSANTRPVVIINERLARQYWPDQSPIGRSIVVRFAGPPVTRDIVGVVGDAKRNLAQEPPAALYIPHAQNPTGDLSFVVHTSQEPAIVVPLIRAAIQSVAPDTGLGSIASLDTLLDSTLSPPRFTLMMVSFFAAAALLVGAIGTYGVIAYSTAERTKEIGIRLALGGGRRDVLVTIMGDGIRIAGIGVVVGLVLAASLSRLIADLLYGITPIDWPAYVSAAAALSAIALIACGVPAWRAARLDPLTILRAD